MFLPLSKRVKPEGFEAQCTGKKLRAKQTQQMGGNSIAVKTQLTSVNPGTKVTRSHTPTSGEAKARARSTYPN